MTRSAALLVAASLLLGLTALARPRTPEPKGLDLASLKEVNRRLDLVVSGRARVPAPVPEQPLPLPVRLGAAILP